MESLKTLLLLAMLMALAITLSATITPSDQSSTDQELSSLKGRSRFLSQIHDRSSISTVQKYCNKNPKICSVKGSAGPDCCNNKCVSLSTDRFNCGKCGKKCSYRNMCCGGKCVNPSTNKQHCGRCGNKCKTGSSCAFGMCSYA